MLVDTHCHLDAHEFATDRAEVLADAWQAGLEAMIIPAVTQATFAPIQALCAQERRCFYALGWNPLYVNDAPEDAIASLSSHLQAAIESKQLVAVGEIGLDFFVTRQQSHQEVSNQQATEALKIHFFVEQLKLAQRYDLPVILHVRGAIDTVLKYLRLYPVRGGIAHAFNGSMQQAQAFIDLGFKLGFGGAMTYPRALKIRALAEQLPLEAIVLETDAPDIPPEWLGHGGRNSPKELLKIAEIYARIRGIKVSQIIEMTGKNSMQVFPKIAHLCTPLKVTL